VPAHIKLNQLEIALARANRSIQLIIEDNYNYIDRAIFTLVRGYSYRSDVYKAMEDYRSSFSRWQNMSFS